jgi:hypothetical protein
MADPIVPPVLGASYVARNGESGALERVTYCAGRADPIAWLRDDFGNLQTFSMNGLRLAPALDCYGIPLDLDA